MCAEVADALEDRACRAPLARVEGLRPGVVERAAGHQVDREIETDDDPVRDAVVELQRALKRVVYELAVALSGVRKRTCA